MVAYRPDIDGLRAVAIVSVVAFHANQTYLPGGFTGVDIFFVISGYLISRIILTDVEAGKFSFTNFWIRRSKRILPALIFMLLVVTAVALYLLLPDDLDQYGQLLSHTVIFAANIFQSNEKGYFDPEGLDSPLLHVWSLAVEEQYYLLWPILLVILLRVMNRRFVILVVALLCCVSLAYSEWASLNSPKEAFFGLPSRAFELLIGAGLAVVNPRQIKSQVLAGSLSICGVVLICMGLLLIDEKSRFPGMAALIPTAGAVLLILSGGRSAPTLAERLLSSPIFVGIGRISYSWYLWHWPPLAFTRYYFERPLTTLEIAIALGAGLGMAVISWRFVERPFRRPVQPAEFRRVFLPMAICSAVVLLGLGTAFQSLSGIPSRMGKDAFAMWSEFEPDRSLRCIDPLKKDSYWNECVFGKLDAAGPSMMLWGDSHADHYLPAIAKIAAAQGVKGVARVRLGCRPFIVADAMERSTPRRTSCAKSNAETLAKLLAQPNISVVVLAARWDARDIVPGDADGLDAFKQNFERTLAVLEQKGKKVVVLGQVPLATHSLKNCLTKQVRFGIKIPGCEEIPLDLTGSYEKGVLNAMQSLSEEHREATFFAPRPILCGSSACRAINEQGRPLYLDYNHLTVRGAYFLEPHISKAIAPLLRGSLLHITRNKLP